MGMGSGKSSIAQFLVKKLPFHTYAFAEPIKEACAKLFHFSKEQMEDRQLKEQIDPRWGISPRDAFRLIGHGFRQSVCDDIWIKHMQVKLSSPYRTHTKKSIVIEDVRYQNEIDFIESLPNGVVIRVIRPGIADRKHASETQQTSVRSGITIVNDYDVPSLTAKAMFALNDLGYFAPSAFECALAAVNQRQKMY